MPNISKEIKTKSGVPVFATNIIKNQVVNNSIKFILQNAFKMSAFHIFLVLKLWDVLYVCFVCPWLSAHKASVRMKARESGRQAIMSKAKNISLHTPKKDFKKAMAHMWAERAKSK